MVKSDASPVAAGMDIGTTSSKAVVMRDGELLGFAVKPMGVCFRAAGRDALLSALSMSGLSDTEVDSLGTTGFGHFHAPASAVHFGIVHSVARGARYIYGSEITTIVDMGGQTVTAIRLYDWDRVRDFAMNDKCATGMGRGVEIMADLLGVSALELGEKSLLAEQDPEPVSTTCFNFAIPETIGLLRRGFKEEAYRDCDVAAAFMMAVAWRILGVVGRLQPPTDLGDIKVNGAYAFTGGLSKNRGITKRIERELKQDAVNGTLDPQLAGAVGAALLAAEKRGM